jgi:predicted transcriptional regulator
MLDSPSVDDPVIALTARIVAAYVVKHRVATAQLPDLIAQTHMTLKTLGQAPVAPEEPERPTPPVSIRKSIQNDYLISLEDGKQYKSLKRHLMARYGMTPEQYREKWGLPKDYPMVAPAYAAKRSELAKRLGLGSWRSGRSSAAKSEA